VLLAHGTRDAAGAAEIERLAGLVGAQVAVCLRDVRHVTGRRTRRPFPAAVVVPAFLLRLSRPGRRAGAAR